MLKIMEYHMHLILMDVNNWQTLMAPLNTYQEYEQKTYSEQEQDIYSARWDKNDIYKYTLCYRNIKLIKYIFN